MSRPTDSPHAYARRRHRGALSLVLAVELGGVLLCTAGASWATFKLTASHYEQRLAEQARQAQAQADTQTESYALRGRAYEAWRSAQRPRVVTLIKEIERATENHRGWSDTVLPDSVRQSLERAATESGAAGQPGGAVPALPGPAAADEP